MKHSLTVIAILAAIVPAFGQGTVFVSNHIGDNLNAPVYYSFGAESGPADARFLGQLFGGPVGGMLGAVGAPLPFRSEPAAVPGLQFLALRARFAPRQAARD